MFAVLGDVHFGVKSDNPIFLKWQLDYLELKLIPYLKDHNINTLVQLGDFNHSRKNINIRTLYWVKKRFLSVLKREGITMHIFPGNHDQYYVNENGVSGIEVLKEFDNIHIYEKPTLIEIEGQKCGMIPWIANEKDRADFLQFKKDNPIDILFGHFEITSFDVMPGVTNQSGENPSMFEDVPRVFTGHFHHKQKKANIQYIGIPFELTWSDFGDDKGIWIIDGQKDFFVKNETTLFHKIFYSEDKIEELTASLSQYAAKVVKIIILNKKNDMLFNQFVIDLEKVNPESFTVFEYSDHTASEMEVVNDENKTLIEVISDYIKELYADDEKVLTDIVSLLYKETQYEEKT